MAETYQTAQPQFIDYIYQPNTQMQMALAQKQIESDRLKKAFADQLEYQVGPTFQGWKGSMNEAVNAINEQLDPVVQQLIKDPYSREAFMQLKQITRDAKSAYTEGDIGKMMYHYNTYADEVKRYEDLIAKEKDPNTRAEMNKRLEAYSRSFVPSKVGDKFDPNFNVGGIQDYLDAQGYLRENIDPETMKIITEGLVLDPKTKQLITSQLPGVAHQYFYMTQEGEKFNKAGIETLAQSQLANSQAFRNMVLQDYRDFGARRTDEKGNIIEETPQEYLQKRIESEAKNYARQFSGYTSKVKPHEYKDDVAIYQDKLNAKKAKETPLGEISIQSSTKDNFREGELKQSMDDFMNLLANPSKNPEQFEKLKDLWNPIVNNYSDEELKTISDYYPHVQKSDIFIVDIYASLAEKVKKESDYLSSLDNKDIVNIFKVYKAEEDKLVDSYLGYNPILGPGQDAREKTIEENIDANLSNKLNWSKRERLKKDILRNYRGLKEAENLYEKASNESEDLMQAMEDKLRVNEDYYTVPLGTSERGQKPAKETIDAARHIGQFKSTGNLSKIYYNNISSTDYKGDLRASDASPENVNPISEIEAINKSKGANISDLIINGTVSVSMKPLGNNMEEVQLVYPGEDGKDQKVTLVYEDVSSNYWQNLANTNNLTPEQKHFMMQYDDRYNKLTKQSAYATSRVEQLKPVELTESGEFPSRYDYTPIETTRDDLNIRVVNLNGSKTLIVESKENPSERSILPNANSIAITNAIYNLERR